MQIDSTTKALSLIFNRSLLHGEMPIDQKNIYVVLIFKKSSKGDKNNYRPISVTSIVGKLLESIIRDQVQKFLDENKLIYLSQHSLTKGKSCLKNLIDSFDKILNGMI